MSSIALSKRGNWQKESMKKSKLAESLLAKTLQKEFKGTDFILRIQPNDFKNIYRHVEMPEEVLNVIYHPDRDWIHGIRPDFAISNLETLKSIYVDSKRQNGWIKGGKVSDGRGNAHERGCKYLMPGLADVMRDEANLPDDVWPFWIIFQGDITRDPKRNREVHLWYRGLERHFFMWTDTSCESTVIKHFNDHLKNLLEN